MRVLALDTTTEACSVALYVDGDVHGIWREAGRGHAELILEMVDSVLAAGSVAIGALDGIAACVGPGSFTGVRISVAVAQGLAFGAGLPVVGVTGLEALALQAMRQGATRALACLDARMGEVYWGCFGADAARGLAALGPSRVSPPAAVATPFAQGCVGIGRGFAAYPDLGLLAGVEVTQHTRSRLPDSSDIVRLGVIRLSGGGGLDPADLLPVYLRDKVAFTEAERAAGLPIG